MTVRRRLLGQVIIDDQCVLSLVTEVFAHGASRIGCDVLQRGRITRTGRYDDGVFHGTVFFEYRVDLSHRRLLLPASHIDTVNIRVLLSKNRIDGTSGFPDLPVTDDQFALASPHRGHGINRF